MTSTEACRVPRVYKHALAEFYARSGADEPNDICYWAFRVKKRRQIYAFLTKALRELGLPARILDFGCSEASDLEYSLRRLVEDRGNAIQAQLSVHGVDGISESVELARQWFADCGWPAVFLVTDITAPLPYSNGYFDIVLCSEVVEHMEQPEALLREAYRLLRSGGFLILTTDNDPSFWVSAKLALRRLVGRTTLSAKDEYHLHGRKATAQVVDINGRSVEVYGHINTRATADWEAACRAAGFQLHSLGTYDQVRRHAGGATPLKLATLFGLGFLVSLMPPHLGRHFDATTSLLLRKP